MAQAVVGARAALGPDAHLAEGQVDIVHDQKHLSGLQLVKRHGVRHREPAQIHEGLGLDEHQLFPAQKGFADHALELQFFDGRVQLRRDDADDVKPDVVPGMLVFFARVPQAHNGSHGCRPPVQNPRKAVPGTSL